MYTTSFLVAASSVVAQPYHSLVKLPDLNLNIWVDASTSWGIVLIIGPCWAGWKRLSGW